jgi:Raf kinase inhibitor-like YbhB/YbcL family protein
MVCGLLAGCEKGGPSKVGAPTPKANTGIKMDVRLKGVDADGRMAMKYTADGDDVSPAVSWSGAPAGTQELALVVDDPDAPLNEPFVHWVMYKIPAAAPGLEEGVPKQARLASGALQGQNSMGGIGYSGPNPPKENGPHHYHFHVYALDSALKLEPGAEKKAVLKAITGHVLAEGEAVGVYSR